MLETITVGAVHTHTHTHTYTSIRYIFHALKQKLRLKTGPPEFSLFFHALNAKIRE